MLRIASLIITISLLVYAGLTQTNGKVRFFCSYGEENHGAELCQLIQQRSFASNYHAERAVDKILKPLGLKSNFVLVSCPNIRNAEAITLDGDTGDGLRYIVYDNAFMEGIDRDSNTNWASLSILAHEIGHHLSGHTTLKQHNPPTIKELEQSRKNELEADEFSGFAMFKVGATLAQAQAAMMALDEISGPEEESDHPKKWRRLEAIKTGYMNARSQQRIPDGRVDTTTTSNISGVWIGRLWQESTGAEFRFAMKLGQNGNSARGQAVAKTVPGGYLGEWDVRVTVYSTSVFFKDLALTRSTMPLGRKWCIKEGTLDYDPTTNRIHGVIGGYYTIEYGIEMPCPSVSVDLYKR